MSGIISVIIIVIGYLLIAFIRDLSRSNRYLKRYPLNYWLRPMVDKINEEFYGPDEKGEIKFVSRNRFFLVKPKDTVMFEFYSYAMAVGVKIHYKWFHDNKYVTFDPKIDLELLIQNPKAQLIMAEKIIEIAKNIRVRQIEAVLYGF